MYTDMLIKIKNAQAAEKKTLKVPYSKMDFAVAELLVKNKFLASVEKKGKVHKRIIAIALNAPENHIRGIKVLSKSSRRVYGGYKELRPVKQGYGTAVLSTPKGILTGKEARQNKVGGEILFHIW